MITVTEGPKLEHSLAQSKRVKKLVKSNFPITFLNLRVLNLCHPFFFDHIEPKTLSNLADAQVLAAIIERVQSRMQFSGH
jgi:hypothetical protein